jgi:MYXO-CTERM domain-containing protein
MNQARQAGSPSWRRIALLGLLALALVVMIGAMLIMAKL